MPANSPVRRAIKRALAPIANSYPYQLLQSVAMGWDIRSGQWTEPELDLIPYVVKPGDTALDIGANFGIYSYHLSSAVAPGGKVYAFEPIPATAKSFRIIGRVLGFDGVELFEKGCGDQAKRVNFRVPLQENGAIIPGIVHLAGRDNERPGKERHARFERFHEVPCDIVVLDDFLPALSNVSFIKCDIEGADYYALKGARNIIQRNLPLVVTEINPWFLEGFGVDLREFVGFFEGMGYGLFRYVEGRLISTPLSSVEEDNWVFLHPDRRSAVAALL
jgi:FkbM family methyltransferase